jgi:hypothetical protein
MELEHKPVSEKITLMLEFPALSPELLKKLESLAPEDAVVIATGRRNVTVEIAKEQSDDFMAAVFQAHLPLASFCYRGRTLETLFMDTTAGIVQ